MSEVFQRCEKHFEEIVAIRRDLHMHPETGFDVERTAGVAAEEMEKLGLKVQTKIGRTGVVADLEIPGANRRIALRADMDALEMDEIASPPYKSKVPGKAHMCGHDAHTAMLIGAARVICEMKAKLKNHVRFIFQPCEEQLPGGAPAMIKDGAIEGVDEIYALHVWPSLNASSYGAAPGEVMAQPDNIEIVIEGKGSHAALPEEGIDTILVASEVVTSLHSIIPRNLKALDSAVLSITTFQSGSAFNIMPHQALLRGTIRTYKKEIQKTIRQRIEDILRGTEIKYGVKCRLKYLEGYPVTFNDENCTEKARRAMLEIVPPEQVIFPHERVFGGEDFAYFTQKIPSAYLFLGCRNEEKGIHYVCHDPRFDIDEECMKYGMALHTSIVLQ